MDQQLPLQALIAKYRDYAEFAELDLHDINEKPHPDDDALIHLVARIGSPDELELLAASGARLNESGDMGYTPLHNAAIFGRLNMVEKLLELGANPNVQDEFGDTAAVVAVTRGHPEIADLLAKSSLMPDTKD